MDEFSEYVKRQVKRPLSDSDIVSAVNKIGGKIKILSYPELQNYSNIKELFGSYKYIALLYTADPRKVGHWVLLIKHNNKEIELFDSYGYIGPDKLLKFFKKEGKELYPYLTNLLEKSGIKKLHHSAVRLQRLTNESGTCGRWVILRVFYDLIGLGLVDMIRDIKSNQFFPKGHYDGYVVFLTQDLVGSEGMHEVNLE